MKPIVVIGAGGHAREIIAATIAQSEHKDRRILGVLALDDSRAGRLDRLGLSVLGPPSILPSLEADYIVGVGHPATRRRLDEEARRCGASPISVVHPTAIVGPDVDLRDGTYLAAASVVTINATIGTGAHINVGASVHHDCAVDEYAFVGPGARVGGWVTIGAGAFVGIGAVIKDEITIGAGATVGAGAVVVSDVEPGTTVVGCPARPLPAR